MKVNINQRIERLKDTVIMIALLSFLAIGLSIVFYPELTQKVAILCLAPFSVMFGWCIGLMDAQRNES